MMRETGIEPVWVPAPSRSRLPIPPLPHGVHGPILQGGPWKLVLLPSATGRENTTPYGRSLSRRGSVLLWRAKSERRISTPSQPEQERAHLQLSCSILFRFRRWLIGAARCATALSVRELKGCSRAASGRLVSVCGPSGFARATRTHHAIFSMFCLHGGPLM